MDRRDEDAIRSRVLSALGDNRVRGYSFLGHLLRLGWPRIGTDSLVVTMDAGPHGRDPDGRVSLIALCGMLDIGLATAPRLSIGPAARQATVQLHLQFTGAPAKGPLALEAAFEASAPALPCGRRFRAASSGDGPAASPVHRRAGEGPPGAGGRVRGLQRRPCPAADVFARRRQATVQLHLQFTGAPAK
ncbi:hypothetical protein CNY89_17625, partial [Amaricoccus sp. HAR-UPW-R2A-40]